ncbi:DUF448 domain-containing protein [Oceanivirga miroungae]|uniref:YlxR domain-containing protein n=1 Tax=Oceanivirga miroungae TaxID=1130046 RepID=A0A6I8MAG0_9FUSO|nr:DUF448 domain-containing protein [Oceanivirga miroungae]VWL85308.1 hypothetical protein OMES3154_00592 [Oceanivirga miroungae]
MKKEPIRTCVYTRVKKSKNELLRLVKNSNDEYILDERKIMQKRAIYIDVSKEVLFLIDKNKKYSINELAKEKIKKIIEEKIKVGGENVK